MKKNSLIIKHQNNSFSINGSRKEIADFVRWVKNYRRGELLAESIVCSSPTDMQACRMRAKHQKLTIV